MNLHDLFAPLLELAEIIFYSLLGVIAIVLIWIARNEYIWKRARAKRSWK